MPSSATKVFYGDGSIVELEDGEKPAEVRDVQVIVQEHPDIGWHTQSGHDYYVWRDGRYVGVDIFGLFDWCMENGVLFGRTMTTKDFQKVMKQALADLGDAKTGWKRDERQL